ncbi:MAG: sensor histidine kinase [Elusimicrobiota bacterium]
MQSTNEELTTVNEELQNQNLELGQANNDLNNLFNSANLPIIMLGNDLRIRRLTRTAEKLLSILPTDVGRPLSDLKLHVSIPDLETLLLSVLDTVQVKELEIQDRQGRWYSLRIHPYKTAEKKIDGAVLFFVDIDSVKGVEKLTRGLEELKIAQKYSEGIVQTVRGPLLILDAGLRVIRGNPSFYRAFQVSKEETENKLIHEIGNGQWDIPRLKSFLKNAFSAEDGFEDYVVERIFPRIGRRTMLLSGRRIVLDGAGTQTILLAMEDITDRKRSEKRMKAALEEKEILLREVHHRVKNNLQIISSLLKMQSGISADDNVSASLRESQDRIQAIALVHEKLYGSDSLSSIDMGQYAEGLASQLIRSYDGSERIGLQVRADRVSLGVETALSCGLILNELVSNALKHAFPNGQRGTVRVEVRAGKGRQVMLEVGNDGLALPEGLSESQGGSLGLRLVRQLAEQLGGSLTIHSSLKGAAMTVRFPSHAGVTAIVPQGADHA